MNDKAFVDTNIWVYAHLDAPGDSKRGKASTLIARLPRPIISTQVLNEYYSAMLKNGAQDNQIQENIEALAENCEVELITLPVIRLAHRIKRQYRHSYWDSLIIASALDAQCQTLYTEDLQNSQVIEGLTIVNPFAEIH